MLNPEKDAKQIVDETIKLVEEGLNLTEYRNTFIAVTLFAKADVYERLTRVYQMPFILVLYMSAMDKLLGEAAKKYADLAENENV